MEINSKPITIKYLVKQYENDVEQGVYCLDGNLDVRPPYQREFIYAPTEQKAVMKTILAEFPLSLLYWIDKGDGKYEVLDGQQRIISICEYLNNNFSVEFEKGRPKSFENLTDKQQEQIKNYKLDVRVCEGDDNEKLEWFRVINVAGKPLTEQEMRNAIYNGPWVTAAKAKFSRASCNFKTLDGDKYIAGDITRQAVLEKMLEWIIQTDNDMNIIEDYMNKHRRDENADELWNYFTDMLDWIKATFPKYDKTMKGVDWGTLYNNHKGDKLDPERLQQKILKLIDDDEVQSVKGIYPYLLTGQEKHLNLRAFNDKQKRKAHNKQNGKCEICEKKFAIDDMQADHKKRWRDGGKTIDSNLQMLCVPCHEEKSKRQAKNDAKTR